MTVSLHLDMSCERLTSNEVPSRGEIWHPSVTGFLRANSPVFITIYVAFHQVYFEKSELVTKWCWRRSSRMLCSFLQELWNRGLVAVIENPTWGWKCEMNKTFVFWMRLKRRGIRLEKKVVNM